MTVNPPAPRREDHGAVLAGVKVKPSGWPAASLDTACGRHPTAPVGGRPTRERQQVKIPLTRVSTESGDCQGRQTQALVLQAVAAGADDTSAGRTRFGLWPTTVKNAISS